MLAFLLILLPLLVLAWQAWQSLNALSDQAALVNRTTLIDARRSEAMTNAALEMERSYRQYCVLDYLRLRRFIKASASVTAKCSMPTQAYCQTINFTRHCVRI
ncbi:hypothetical protein ACLB1M_20230 [Escherichia coli]